jgi:hypothetical protein
MKFKDDVAFLIDDYLNLYEHQSTLNPNMPLRGFLYYADVYRKLINGNELLYSRRLLKIPTPKYVVLYNGGEEQADVVKLKLSDAFEHAENSGEFEWTATVLNINYGRNENIMNRCEILKEYAQFIQLIRENQKHGMSEMEAIDAAIAKSKTDTYFGLFLAQHEREVKNMCLTEFDQDKYDEMIRRESREEGREEGRNEGIELGLERGRAQGLERGLEQGVKRTKLIFRMERDGKTISEIAKVAGISEREVREILED